MIGTVLWTTRDRACHAFRASFNKVRAANWHTPLNPPSSSGIVSAVREVPPPLGPDESLPVLIDDPAALHSCHAVVDAEVIGNLAVVVQVHHHEVSLFADLQGTKAMGTAQ